MNWALLALFFIVAFCALAGWVYSVVKHSFGPFFDDGDHCSTDSPERDYEDHR